MSAFKAYDIRGIYNVDFNAETVYRIGRCLPKLLGADRVLVGHDARKSSPEIYEALVRGLTEAGANVDKMGFCTTPMTYYFTGAKGYPAAVMITASHNPKEYNGLKISRKGALPVGEDSGLKELERMIGEELPAAAEKPGEVSELNLLEEYLAYHRSWLGDLSGLNFIVDCSNGMAGLFARKLFGEGAIYLNEEPDGSFPNHPPNPLIPEATAQLSEAVVKRSADFGIIFDGDADRVAFVNEKGEFVRPDMITGVLAESFIERESGCAVLCDIRTSRGVTEHISALGGRPHLWKVGHAFAKVKLRELKAIGGGELAGHYYFRDFYHCDSAVLCAELVLQRFAAAKKEGRSFSELLKQIDIYANSGECNYTVEKKDEAMQAVDAWVKQQSEPPEAVLDFDGYRYEWADWWFNVRKSNTEPYLRLIVEAKTQQQLEEKKAQIEAVIRSVR